jgi:hypothetical protein
LGERNVELAVSDPKAGETVGKNLTDQFNGELQIAGHEMASEVNKLFESYKKGKPDLTEFRIKSSCKIAVSAIAIVDAAGVAVASHGTLTPFAGRRRAHHDCNRAARQSIALMKLHDTIVNIS